MPGFAVSLVSPFTAVNLRIESYRPGTRGDDAGRDEIPSVARNHIKGEHIVIVAIEGAGRPFADGAVESATLEECAAADLHATQAMAASDDEIKRRGIAIRLGNS